MMSTIAGSTAFTNSFTTPLRKSFPTMSITGSAGTGKKRMNEEIDK